MVSPQVQGSFVNEQKRFGSFGAWLQIFMPDSLVDAMVEDFDRLLSTPNVSQSRLDSSFLLSISIHAEFYYYFCFLQVGYPKTFLWPQWSFSLTLVL